MRVVVPEGCIISGVQKTFLFIILYNLISKIDSNSVGAQSCSCLVLEPYMPFSKRKTPCKNDIILIFVELKPIGNAFIKRVDYQIILRFRWMLIELVETVGSKRSILTL